MNGNNHKSPPEWQQFELLAAEIQRQLAPGGRIQTNVKLPGKRSGIDRQVDILVEQEVGQYSIRIIIDCKDYKNPADVKDVEAFLGMVEDVGANKGAMIASSGFTSTAKQRAKDAGVDLYTVVDTRSTKWRKYVSLPCVVRDLFIHTVSFQFSGTGRLSIANTDFRFLQLFRADESLIDCLQNLLSQKWDAGAIPEVPGEYSDIPASSEETFMKAPEGLQKVNVHFNVGVSERLRFGQVGVDDVQGLNNELTGTLITKKLTTSKIYFDQVAKHWEPIISIEQLSIKPTLILSVKSVVPLIEPVKSTAAI